MGPQWGVDLMAMTGMYYNSLCMLNLIEVKWNHSNYASVQMHNISVIYTSTGDK